MIGQPASEDKSVVDKVNAGREAPGSNAKTRHPARR